jgi:SPP1 gp7 family putative phage head morphogenesis protein
MTTVAERFRADLQARSRGLARPLARLLQRAEVDAFRRAVRAQLGVGGLVAVAKDEATDALAVDVLSLLRMFGLRQVEDATRRAAASVGHGLGDTWVLRPRTREVFLAAKEIKVKDALLDIRAATAEKVRRVVVEAERETPRPSIGEIAHRLREEFNYSQGVPSAFDPIVPGEGRMPSGSMSAVRAERIARTETVQALNTGAHEGYLLAGIQRQKWLAIRDGRTRDSHAELHGTIVGINEPFVFVGEGGRKVSLRYPGDPSGPPEEIINCRCTIAPVVR